MPESFWASQADSGRPCFSSKASTQAIERMLCEPVASLTPPSPGVRGIDSTIRCGHPLEAGVGLAFFAPDGRRANPSARR